MASLLRDEGVGVHSSPVVMGALLGPVNAFFTVGLRVIPFVVTVSTLLLFRGFGA